MLENGYIKLHRSLLKWEWYDDINVFKLFIHLLLTVNLYDEKWQGKTIKRGTRVTSYSVLSKETNLSMRQVRTALNKLSATQSVTIKTTPKYTVVTVNNYDKFQTATQSMTNKRQSEIDDFCKQTINNENNTKKTTQSVTQSEMPIFPIDKANGENNFETATQSLTNKRQSDDTVATQWRQQREKDKESIRKYKKERGSETLPNSIPLPTLSEIVDFCFENKLKVNPNKFFYYYQNKGWSGVNNWQMKLMEWNETERPAQNNQANKFEKVPVKEDFSFDLEEYEKQLRQTPSLDWLD